MTVGRPGSPCESAITEQGHRSDTLERIRVLVVGGPEVVPGLEPPGEDDSIDIVGRIEGVEEIVSAIDVLHPHVLVLGSTLLQMAFRMASSPASVVVVPDPNAKERRSQGPMGPEAHLLKIAMLLAAARPQLSPSAP